MDGNVLKALHGLECYQFLIAKVKVGGSWRVNKVQIVSQRPNWQRYEIMQGIEMDVVQCRMDVVQV